jgi:hypothetical protein
MGTTHFDMAVPRGTPSVVMKRVRKLLIPNSLEPTRRVKECVSHRKYGVLDTEVRFGITVSR